MVVVAIMIGLYWVYLRKTYGEKMANNDLMNEKIIDLPWLENCCSWWPISHFIFYAILGFLFPNCAVIILGLGILWEVLEVIFGKLVVGSQWKRQALREDDGSIEYSQNWWAGSFKDIIMNTGGFFVGYMLNKFLISNNTDVQSQEQDDEQ